MTQAVEQILSSIGNLSQGERAELAYAVLLSLEPQEDGVEEAWNTELSGRVARIRSGQAVGKPAEQVFAELREKRS